MAINKLTYMFPAHLWREALPIGNGYTGVMIYGGKRKEKLSFNDGTLWSGYPKNQNNSASLENLNKVRGLVFEGKNDEADKLCMEELRGAYSESFLPLGELCLSFSSQNYLAYKRELDIENAVHTVTFDGVKRETFCSNAAKITVYRIESEKNFSVKINAKSKLHFEVATDEALNLIGNAPDYVAPNYLRTEKKPVRYTEGKGMSFCLRCEIETDGKKYFSQRGISVKAAKTVTLYIATATGFCGFDKVPETSRDYPFEKCKQILNSVSKNYEYLRTAHIEDYSSLYNRQSVSLGTNSGNTTDKILKDAKGGKASPELCELLYNYGKYLMISGSRSGGQALNLQGIWNKSVRPPWSSNYTTNINTEMNYWGMSRSGLCECAEPYIRLVHNILKNGKKTAKVNYGCEGFCCNHNVDIWCKTAPVQGSPAYMYAPLCGAWLANELYLHLKNGNLEKYRNEITEITTEAVKFINDYLVLHDGFYVTAPSASPEALFKRNEKSASLDYASTFEMCIVRQAFANYQEFASDELAAEIREKAKKLYPISCGDTGVLEWHDNVPITEKGHRHFSPLYGFYPANVIKYYADKEKTKWVKALFDYRTDNSSQYIGWSAAWAICLCGRLHDAEKAQGIVNSMLAHSVFKNLFCVHPPFLFQIDGNLGFVAGVNELLVYEEKGIIELLPALPKSWKKGNVKNMTVNGVQISFSWENGLITHISSDKPVKILKTAASDNAETSDLAVFVSGENK